MKRMFMTAVTVVAATAAFAAPAGASEALDADVNVGTACYPGEKTDECLIRIGRNAPDLVFDYAAWALYEGGNAAELVIDTAENLCERHLSGCSVPMP